MAATFAVRKPCNRMVAFYLTSDLLFSSRVSGAAQRAGVDLRTVGSLEKLLEAAQQAGGCSLVIVDLTLPKLDITTAVTAIKERFSSARIVAYGPHVHEAKLAAASSAGCDEVLTRGQFDREMDRVLRGDSQAAP